MTAIRRHRNADGKYVLQVEPPADTITPWDVNPPLSNITQARTPTACSSCLRDVPSREPFAITFCDGDDFDLDLNLDNPAHLFVICGDCTEDFLDMCTDAQLGAYKVSRALATRHTEAYIAAREAAQTAYFNTANDLPA